MPRKVKLLLADCKRMDGTLLPVDGLIGCWDPSASFVGFRNDAIVVECEPTPMEDGNVVPSLLVRPFFCGDDLEAALREKAPIPIVAYWRRYGFTWTKRSIRCAQRFRLGLGGALMATLVPLLEKEAISTDPSPGRRC